MTVLSGNHIDSIARGVLHIAVKSIPIHQASNFTVEKKADGSPVSNLDIQNQRELVRLLYSSADGIPILAEEDDGGQYLTLESMPTTNTYCTVDPIDGTSPCAAGYKNNWNVAVGLVDGGVPILGIVGMPNEGKVIVGGPLIDEVYVLDLSGNKEEVRPAVNKNKLWGMDMATDVAQDLFLTELNRRLVADRNIGGYPTNVPSIQSGIDLILGRTKFFLTANAKMWDIAPIAAFASQLGYMVQHVDESYINWTSPHRHKLSAVILAESAQMANAVSDVYMTTKRIHEKHKDRIRAAWQDD